MLCWLYELMLDFIVGDVFILMPLSLNILKRQKEKSIAPFLLGTDINRKVSFQASINGSVYNDV